MPEHIIKVRTRHGDITVDIASILAAELRKQSELLYTWSEELAAEALRLSDRANEMDPRRD